jgi:hypothetical protein
MKLKRLLICPDSHIPYEDKDAFELMLRAASIFKPDTFIIGGDFADFYSVSSHNKDPSRGNDLQKEVDAVKARLDEIQKRVKPKEKVFICGNHEERLERYLMSEAPALWNSVKIPNILGLKERGWRYIPYRDHVKIGKLHVTHDIGQAGKYAHYQACDAYQGNVVINHTHRIGYGVTGSLGGSAHVGAMFGWLGDFNRIDYMHRAKARRDWAHGFGYGYQEVSGNIHLRPAPIISGRVAIEGRLVTL